MKRVGKAAGRDRKSLYETKSTFPHGERGSPERSYRWGQGRFSLLWRGWRKHFAALRGFGFRLRLGSLLNFFSAFVFASHVCKCATNAPLGGSP